MAGASGAGVGSAQDEQRTCSQGSASSTCERAISPVGTFAWRNADTQYSAFAFDDWACGYSGPYGNDGSYRNDYPHGHNDAHGNDDAHRRDGPHRNDGSYGND
jgi:hypothetical protein